MPRASLPIPAAGGGRYPKSRLFHPGASESRNPGVFVRERESEPVAAPENDEKSGQCHRARQIVAILLSDLH